MSKIAYPTRSRKSRSRRRRTIGDRSSKSFRSSVSWPAPLAREAFHGLAGELVRIISPESEADPAALLVQSLVAFGNVVGRRPYFKVEADRHTTNLFAVLVGETAKARKGSSWGHVRRISEAIDPAWKECLRSGLSTGEGLIEAVRDEEDGQRSEEGASGVLDKRLLVHEPELAGPLRRMDREGNTLSATIREAWDTGELSILTRKSPARATGAHISIVAHTTRDDVRRYLNRTDAANGFANRFLWVCVRRSRILPEGGRIEERDVENLTERLSSAARFAPTVSRVRFDKRARAIWEAVYPTLSEGKPGLLGSVIARGEAQVIRLALLYALLDKSAVIKCEHLLAALALWDYCEASARYIFGGSLGDPVADAILRELQDARNGLTRTKIRDLFAHNRGVDEIQRALEILSQRGLARCEVGRPSGRGRPAERWIAEQWSTTETTRTTKNRRSEDVRSSLSFPSYLALARKELIPSERLRPRPLEIDSPD